MYREYVEVNVPQIIMLTTLQDIASVNAPQSQLCLPFWTSESVTTNVLQTVGLTIKPEIAFSTNAQQLLTLMQTTPPGHV